MFAFVLITKIQASSISGFMFRVSVCCADTIKIYSERNF
jgi:hypothetical protein